MMKRFLEPRNGIFPSLSFLSDAHITPLTTTYISMYNCRTKIFLRGNKLTFFSEAHITPLTTTYSCMYYGWTNIFLCGNKLTFLSEAHITPLTTIYIYMYYCWTNIFLCGNKLTFLGEAHITPLTTINIYTCITVEQTFSYVATNSHFWVVVHLHNITLNLVFIIGAVDFFIQIM